jgi:hypothetical protein
MELHQVVLETYLHLMVQVLLAVALVAVVEPLHKRTQAVTAHQAAVAVAPIQAQEQQAVQVHKVLTEQQVVLAIVWAVAVVDLQSLELLAVLVVMVPLPIHLGVLQQEQDKMLVELFGMQAAVAVAQETMQQPQVVMVAVVLVHLRLLVTLV